MNSKSLVVIFLMGLLVVTAAVNIIGAQSINSGEVGNAAWGFKFKPPAGWVFQQDNTGAVLGHNTIAGMIMVFPHIATSVDEVKQELLKGLQEEGTVLSLNGELQKLNENAYFGDYTGTYEWQEVKARGVGTISPDGGSGAYIIAITTPEMYGPELKNAAEQIAKAVEYFKPAGSDLVNHFAGRWANSTTYTLTNITLAPDGSYYDQYEASYGGSSYDQYGDVDMTWGAANQEQAAGRWTVRGTKESGQIIIIKSDGSETILEYKVHVERGQTYWSEYWFNGSLYAKQ